MSENEHIFHSYQGIFTVYLERGIEKEDLDG